MNKGDVALGDFIPDALPVTAFRGRKAAHGEFCFCRYTSNVLVILFWSIIGPLNVFKHVEQSRSSECDHHVLFCVHRDQSFFTGINLHTVQLQTVCLCTCVSVCLILFKTRQNCGKLKTVFVFFYRIRSIKLNYTYLYISQ
ncbi:hypothetical protein NL108_018461 [Boleophthalmus pectinirostris]|nr:hypothetical protein NL108_018461 [Boleophthalmus pectinirostris]